jgi:hypothetical protein
MPFVLPPDDLTSSRARLKRDLDLDPEDVLTMLSLLEAEHRAKADSSPRYGTEIFYQQDHSTKYLI